VIADVSRKALFPDDFDGATTAECYEDADIILTALARSGLRVVPAEPSEADVERVAVFARLAKARAYAKIDHRPITPHEEDEMWRTTARAAIRAFLAQGGDDAKDV